MSLQTLVNLQTRAAQIRDATTNASNTATLVGSLFLDIADSLLHRTVSASGRVLGRFSSGAGVVEEGNSATVTAFLSVFTDLLQGVVPASGGGTSNFLRADGAWAEPPSGGGGGGPALDNDTPNAVATSGSAGVDVTAARGDHVHAHGDLPGGSLHAVVVAGGDAGFMTGTDKNKLNGVAANASANAQSGTPAAIVSSGATVGVATTAAPSDHTHDHGNLGGGSQHLAATTSTAGFMSAADKTKLDGVAANAAAVSNVNPVAPAETAAPGVSSTASRADHVHPMPTRLAARGQENVEVDLWPPVQVRQSVVNGGTLTADYSLSVVGKRYTVTADVWVDDGAGACLFIKAVTVRAHNISGTPIIVLSSTVDEFGAGFSVVPSVSGTDVRFTITNSSGSTALINGVVGAIVLDKP